MSVALITVHKTLGGHRWSNTHAVQIGVSSTGIPTDAELVTLGAASAMTDGNTSSNPGNFLQYIVAFERFMVRPDVTVTDVYVTDGKQKKLDPTAGVYANVPVGLAGRFNASGTLAGATLEPGAITLELHRSGPGFSMKPGRMFLRGALTEDAIEVGGARMIQWTSGAAAAYQTNLANAVGPWLTQFFVGGAQQNTVLYGIPHYANAADVSAGQAHHVGELMFVRGINNITVVGPVVRQTQRGRKKKKV